MTWQMDGQISMFDQDTWSGKTSQEHSVQTKGKTSKPSSRKSSKSSSRTAPMCLCLRRDGLSQDASTPTWGGGQLLGEYTTHSFGESPKEENASLLSQILEDSPHPKYYLSAKACAGILNRANRRGKQLPPELEEALKKQAVEHTACKGTESTEQTETDVPEEDGQKNDPTTSIQPTGTLSFQERAGKPGGQGHTDTGREDRLGTNTE